VPGFFFDESASGRAVAGATLVAFMMEQADDSQAWDETSSGLKKNKGARRSVFIGG
jgi:hypothetical protein